MIVSDMFGTFASLSDVLDSPLLLQVLHRNVRRGSSDFEGQKMSFTINVSGVSRAANVGHRRQTDLEMATKLSRQISSKAPE
jgi:hypothetical protein